MTDMVYGAVQTRPGEAVLPRWWRTLDHWSLLGVIALCGVGLLLGLAASPPLAERHGLDPFYYVERQAFFVAIAFVGMLITSMMTPTLIRRLAVIGFVMSLVALALLPVLGTDFGKGAVRWYSLGFASFQPSEFLKPLFMVTIAWLLAGSDEINGPPGRLISFGLMLVIVSFLVFQPDFGQACLIIFGWALAYFVAGAPLILLISIACLVVLGGGFAYTYSDHFASRIDGFLKSSVDPTTQLGYATNAIREGGFFGVGVGEGSVKWSLPDAHTDFVIAVAAEEYGVILVLAIIALFALLTLRSLFRLMRERDPFTRLAGTGLIAIFAMQAVINMGVAVRLLPAKGMTLPFVSNGGSSVIAAGLAFGMILAFTRTRPQGEMRDLIIQRASSRQ